MSIIIKDSHFILQSHASVSALCNPFLSLLNLTYFDYCRIYPDGQMMVLANDPAWVKHFFEANYPAGGEVRKKGVYLWQTHLPEAAICDARNQFNHDNGITILFEQEGYIEFFDFASAAGDNDILYYYTNHFDLFENFFTYFKNTAASLIKEAETHKITLGASDKVNPKRLSINIKKAMRLFSDKNRDTKVIYPIGLQKNVGNLSQRQLDCLYFLTLGMTMKQIAKQLSLSPRTVEAYLDAIKIKLNCTSRIELFEYAQREGE